MAGQIAEKDNTEAVDVGLSTDLAAVESFWSKKTGGTGGVSGFGESGSIESDSIIRKERPFRRIDQDITGLDIAVNHSVVVQKLDTVGDLKENFDGLFWRQYQILGFSLRNVFQDQEESAFEFTLIVDRQDGGMFEPCHQSGFMSQS